MKARTAKMSLLAATFAFISAINAYAVPVDVKVNLSDPKFVARINKILTASKTRNYKNAIREEVIRQQAVAKPLENAVVDPLLTSFMKSQIKAHVMKQLRGTLIGGMPPTISPLGVLPGQIAPPPF